MIYSSGIGTFTRGVITNLPEKHEFILIGDVRKLRSFKRRGIRLYHCTIPPFSWKETLFNHKDLGADCLFLPNYSLLGFLHSKRFITVHDVLFQDMPRYCRNSAEGYLKRLYLKISCRFAKIIFTVSRFSKERVHNVLGNRTVVIVPNGLMDTEEYKKSIVSISKDKNLLVFIGNLKAHKNLTVILDALLLMQDSNPQFHLAVVGKQSDMRTADDKTFKHPLFFRNPQSVCLVNELERQSLLELVASARYVIQPSLYEGFSIVPMEALACGTQPIISEIPVHREIYGSSPAKFFDPYNPKELVEKILEEPVEIPSGFGKRYAEDHGYTYKNCAMLMINTMEKICGT